MDDQNLAADLANHTKDYLRRLLHEHGHDVSLRDLDSVADIIYWLLKANATKVE